MSDTQIPPPPPGFVLEGQQSQSQVPAPPPGFVLEGQQQPGAQAPSFSSPAGRVVGTAASFLRGADPLPLVADLGQFAASHFAGAARAVGLNNSAAYWQSTLPTFGQFKQQNTMPQVPQAAANPYGPEAIAEHLGGAARDIALAYATGGASVPIEAGVQGQTQGYDYLYQLAKQKGMDDATAHNYALAGGDLSGGAQALISRVNPLARAGGTPGGPLAKIAGGVGTNVALGVAGSQIDPMIAAALGINPKHGLDLANDLTDRAKGSLFPSLISGLAIGGYDAIAHRGPPANPHTEPTQAAPEPPAGFVLEQSEPTTADKSQARDQEFDTQQQPQRMPLPPDRLTQPPAGELVQKSNREIRDWALANGYDTSRLEKDNGLGKHGILNELNRQFTNSTAAPRPELPVLPPEAASWDAGRLRQWAGDQGIEIPDAVVSQGRNQPDMPPSKRIYQYLTDFQNPQAGDEPPVSPPPPPRKPGQPPQPPAEPQTPPPSGTGTVLPAGTGEALAKQPPLPPANLKAARQMTQEKANAPKGQSTPPSAPTPAKAQSAPPPANLKAARQMTEQQRIEGSMAKLKAAGAEGSPNYRTLQERHAQLTAAPSGTPNSPPVERPADVPNRVDRAPKSEERSAAQAPAQAAPDNGPLKEHEQEAVETLVALGEKRKDAETLVKRVRSPQITDSLSLITAALDRRGSRAVTYSKPEKDYGEATQQGKQEAAPKAAGTEPSQASGQRDEGAANPQRMAQPAPTGSKGSDTRIATQTGDVPARYEALEADDLIASHNERTFQPDPRHSGGQMRDYAQDKAEQLKVINNSKPDTFDSRQLLTDDPSPANGPPMVDEHGSAIGGNSRTMIAKRVYDDPQQGPAFKQDVVKSASKFGIDSKAVEGMKNPVIVRRLGESGMDEGRRAEMSRVLQKGRTQETSATVDAISRARILENKPAAMATIEGLLEHADSVRDVLGTEGKSRKLLHALQEADVLTHQEISQYATPQGTFTEDGKRLVERVLLATVVKEPHALEEVPQSLVNKLTNNVASLAYVKTRPGWDLSQPIQQAIDAYHRFRADGGGTGVEAFKRWIEGGSGGDAYQTSLIKEPIQDQPQAKKLLTSLVAESTNDFKARLRAYTDEAKGTDPNQGRMFGSEDVKPAQAFERAFGDEVPGGGMFTPDLFEHYTRAGGDKPRYTEVGHEKGDLWWLEGGRLKTAESGGKYLQHSDFPGALTAPLRGRIDHETKQVSITAQGEPSRLQADVARDHLAKQYPDYKVHEYLPPHLEGGDRFKPTDEGTTPRFTERGPQRGRAAEVLDRMARRYDFDGRIVGDEKLTAQDRDVQRVASRFGVTAHFVEGEQLPFRGVVPEGSPNLIFLQHGESGEGLRFVLGHELVHNLRNASPDLYEQLKSALDPKEIAARAADYGQKMRGMPQPLRDAVLDAMVRDPSKVSEEGVADAVGAQVVDPKTWAKLAGEKPGLWEKVKDVLSRIFDRIRGISPRVDPIARAFEQFAERGAGEGGEGGDAEKGSLFAPREDEVSTENLHKAVQILRDRAKGNPSAVKMNRPDLSQKLPSVEGRSVVSAADQLRNKKGEPANRPDESVESRGIALARNPQAVRDRVFQAARDKELLNDHEMNAAHRVLNSDSIQAVRAKDKNAVLDAAKLADALRSAGAEWGRAGRQMRDPVMSPEDRASNIIAKALVTPETKGKPGDAPGGFDADAHLKQYEEIRRQLEKNGYNLDELLAGPAGKPLDLDTATHVIREIQARKSGLGDKIYEYWVNSLLGPHTQTHKAASDAAHAFIHTVLFRPLEAGINAATGNKEGAQPGELPWLYRGMMPGIQRAASNWLRTFRTERPVFDDDVNGTYTLPRAAIPGKVGRIVRIQSRLLQSTTQFAKSLSGTMQAHAEAYREAVGQGLSGQKLADYVAKQAGDLNSTAWQKSLGYANELTFDNDAGKLGRALTNFKNAVPIFKYIGLGPFTNIGIKMTRAGLKMTPLDLIRMAYKGTDNYFQISGNRYTRGEFAGDAARQLVAFGVASALWGGVGGTSPWITGSAASYGNQGKREDEYRNAPPMSIKIGGKWYSYQHVEPVATALQTMVNGIQSIKDASAGKDQMDAAGDFAQKEINMVRDKTFLKALGDAISATQNFKEKAPQWASDFVTSWVPNTLRQPARDADPSVRERKNLGGGGGLVHFGRDVVREGLPGVDLPQPKVDVWGNPVKKGPDAGPATDFLYRMLSPVGITPTDSTRMDRMIAAWNTAHPTEEFYPATPDPVVRLPGQKPQKMDDETYELYLRATGKVASAVLNGPLGEKYLNADQPTADDMKGLKRVLNNLHGNCRQLVASALDSKAKGDTAAYNAAMKQLRDAADHPEQFAGQIPEGDE